MKCSLGSSCAARRPLFYSLLLVGIAAMSVAGRSPAADAPDPAGLQEQLAAGEFGPALRDAGALGDPRVRDQWLGQIAGEARRPAPRPPRSTRLPASTTTGPARGTPGPRRTGRTTSQFPTAHRSDHRHDRPHHLGRSRRTGRDPRIPRRRLCRRPGTATAHAPRRAGRRTGRPKRSKLKALDAGDQYRRRGRCAAAQSVAHAVGEAGAIAAGRRPPPDRRNARAGRSGKNQIRAGLSGNGRLVLAGPAAAWRPDADGRLVSQASGRPILQLDDLVVILRHMMPAAESKFGCSINPREAALAKTKDFLAESAKNPLKEGTVRPLAQATARSDGAAGRGGRRRRPAHPRGPGAGGSRLPHETGRHGPGAGRGGRRAVTWT